MAGKATKKAAPKQTKVRKPTQKSKKACAAYIRTSTKTNKDRGGKARALNATSAAARGSKDVIGPIVHDVVSGAVAFEKRAKLKKLLEEDGVQRIYVEGLRDIAPDLFVGEHIYDVAQRMGKDIFLSGSGKFFSRAGEEETPQKKFERRMGFLTEEYERDCIKHRLQSGTKEKLKTSKFVSQSGEKKLAGRKTILDDLGGASPTTRKEMLKLSKQREKGHFGWRALAKKFQALLKLDSTPAHETARRMVQELALKPPRK